MTRDVNIDIEFIKLGEIDGLKKFHAEIKIISRWIETEHAEAKIYDPQIHWNPQIYAKNLITESKETNKYEIKKLTNALIITEIKRIKGDFWQRMNFSSFPFDLHHLNVIISSYLPFDQIKLIAKTEDYKLLNSETKRSFSDHQEWKLLDIYKMDSDLDEFNTYKLNSSNQKVEELVVKLKKNKTLSDAENTFEINKSKIVKSKIVASCYISRYSGMFALNSFFFLFLTTLSSLTSFSIPQNLPQSRLQTTYTVKLLIVVFKLILNKSIPTTSYLTMIDHYLIFCILFINLLGVWHALIGSFDKWYDSIDITMLIAFAIIFCLYHIFFILKCFSINKLKRHLEKIKMDLIKSEYRPERDQIY